MRQNRKPEKGKPLERKSQSGDKDNRPGRGHRPENSDGTPHARTFKKFSANNREDNLDGQGEKKFSSRYSREDSAHKSSGRFSSGRSSGETQGFQNREKSPGHRSDNPSRSTRPGYDKKKPGYSGDTRDRKPPFERHYNDTTREDTGNRRFNRSSDEKKEGNFDSSERKQSSYRGKRDFSANKSSERYSSQRAPRESKESSERTRTSEYKNDKPFNPDNKGYVKRDYAHNDENRQNRRSHSYSSEKGSIRAHKASDRPEGTRGSRNRSGSSESDSKLMRLNKYVANAGICSRREADELIQAGAIKVNGIVVSELGSKIDPYKDKVQYGDQAITGEKPVYLLLNKPKGYITTSDDPQNRKTVMSLVANACKERIYPVGRLDRNTSGLLLFTNDGEIAKKLTHPKHIVNKIYHVELDKPLTKNDMLSIGNGIELEDGIAEIDEIAYTGEGSKKDIGLKLHSGKNRIVRRIFESLGYDVVKLDRVIFAGLTKKDLPRGRWRFLTEEEINHLKMMR